MATAPDPSAIHVQRFSVPFEYPVAFTDAVLDPNNGTLAWALMQSASSQPPRALFIADEGFAACWPSLSDDIVAYAAAHGIVIDGPLRLVPGGEAAKRDAATVDRVLQWIAKARLDRHAYVVALGGGAMLDAVGYAAALAHRGVRLVRIPTTVLAQNDAGVGVKNGINAFGGKNFLGTFVPPHAVLNDIRWIRTLPDRDRVAGIAEAVKVGLIRDRGFFEWLESSAGGLASGERTSTATMIRRCAELHLHHIATSGDPFEQGSARPLDYGHWSAHKLELLSDHTLRHGEAVSIGMLLDAQYAVLEGRLPEDAFARIQSLLVALGLPVWHEALDRPDDVLAGLEEFREHLGGALTITLLAELGRGIEVHSIDDARMRESIGRLRALRIAS